MKILKSAVTGVGLLVEKIGGWNLISIIVTFRGGGLILQISKSLHAPPARNPVELVMSVPVEQLSYELTPANV